MSEDFFLQNSFADKFSRHLIVIIPKVAFKDNLHVGAFVGEVCFKQQFHFYCLKRWFPKLQVWRLCWAWLTFVLMFLQLCSRIVSKKEKDERLRKLFVHKEANDSASLLFVDTAVYSRNRCFRLALSSKAGKTSVLLPTGRFKCKDMVSPPSLSFSMLPSQLWLILLLKNSSQ